jgi:hypothetical protein
MVPVDQLPIVGNTCQVSTDYSDSQLLKNDAGIESKQPLEFEYLLNIPTDVSGIAFRNELSKYGSPSRRFLYWLIGFLSENCGSASKFKRTVNVTIMTAIVGRSYKYSGFQVFVSRIDCNF